MIVKFCIAQCMAQRVTLCIALCIALLLLGVAACSGEDAGQQAGTEPASDAATRTYTWRMITTWPKNLPGLGVAPETMADMVREMSAGRLDIKVYGAGELVPALEVFEAVSSGVAQMGHGAAYYWKGKLPSAQFFAAVPFGLTAQEMNGWLLHGGGLELWQELYAPYNLIPLPGGNSGVQMAGWFNKEINSLDDLKGLKMRIPGFGGEVFERAGGTAVNLPGGEIFTSMQTGVIDATEWVGPYNDLAFGLHQVARYYYYPGWHEPGTELEFIINSSAYEELPDDLKAIIKGAALAVNTDLLAEYTARNNTALSELVQVHGVEVRRLPDDVLAELKKVSLQLTRELVDDDPLSRRIYDSYWAFREGVTQYHEVSERAYINARAED